MARSKVRESHRSIEDEIRDKLQDQVEVREGVEAMAQKAKTLWRQLAPVDEKDYQASIHVENRFRRIDGLPAKRVTADDFKAHWIEYGTGDPYPTPEFAPAARTAAILGGEAKTDAHGKRTRRIPG